MKSLLRRLFDRGDKVALLYQDDKTVHVEIITISSKEIPDEWLKKSVRVLTASIRQIKEYDEVSSEEIKAFFDSGKKLIEEMTDDEWLINYNMVEIN